ncbi:MAG: hypothetical protein ACOCTN_00775 [Candidatus Natronoplasma sp.]
MLIVFTPAIIVLYYFLGEFERYFKANKALFMVLAGLGVGMFVGFFSLYFPLDEMVWAFAIVLLVETIKLFAMIQKPFRLNYDSSFYGLAFGTGIAAMMVFTFAYSAGLPSLDITTILFVFLISCNYTFVGASTGGIIGYGSTLGEFWRYFGRALLLGGLHAFMMTFVWTFGYEQIYGSFAVLLIGFIYGSFLILYLYNEIFPEVIEEKIEEVKNNKGE